jgi:hypothetical protein
MRDEKGEMRVEKGEMRGEGGRRLILVIFVKKEQHGFREEN